MFFTLNQMYAGTMESKFLAYGADIHEDYNPEFLKEFGLEENGYYLLVARLEPENNIAMAIDGYLASEENGRRPLVIVGKTNTPHGKELVARYGKERSVRFIGGIYHFYSPRLLHRQSQPEIHPYSRTVMMLPGSRPVQHPGKMHSQHSQIINPNMLRSSNIVTGEKAITAILVTT